MMNVQQRLEELHRQRTDLVVRSATQRVELGEVCHAWHLPLAIADRGVAAWRLAQKHPLLVAGVGVGFALTQPRRALKWFQRGWTLWRTYRSMAGR